MKKNNLETCVKIHKNLYLGNYKAAMSPTTLINFKIKYILCMGVEMNFFFPNLYKYMKVSIFDSEEENILNDFNKIYEYDYYTKTI